MPRDDDDDGHLAPLDLAAAVPNAGRDGTKADEGVETRHAAAAADAARAERVVKRIIGEGELGEGRGGGLGRVDLLLIIPTMSV